MQPLVSIITPTYNSEKFIAQTILSLQDQTYQNWEMIIVDDCSSDATQKIVAEFCAIDPRIKYHKLDENSGAGIARNYAMNIAMGRYFAFLDSDDLWKPLKLEKQLAFLISNNLPFTFCFYDCIDEDGKSLHKRVEAPKSLSYRQLFFCNYVGNLTAIYDVNYFGKIAISNIRKRQDWILWLTILKQIKTATPIAESLAIYRIRRNSVSSSKWSLLQHNYAVYRSYHKLNVIESGFCMLGFLFTQLLIKPRYKKITA